MVHYNAGAILEHAYQVQTFRRKIICKQPLSAPGA